MGGRQLGLSDSRDGFPSFISCIERVQPRVWMFENVRGLFYRSNSYFAEIRVALECLEYVVSAQLLNAKHFGVPQNRQRVIVVGHRAPFSFPSRRSGLVTSGDALADLLGPEPENPRYLNASQDAYIAKYEKASHCKNPRDLHMDRPSRTVTCRNLAGVTGDMMRVLLADGRRRRVTVAEAARLQSFLDWYEFEGGG